MASGSGLEQLEDSPDGQSYNLAISHQREAEGDILNPVTRATSRSQPPAVPEMVQAGMTPLVMQLGHS